MEALYVLLPISLSLASGALISFIWATKNGQFSDLVSPSQKILLDDFTDRIRDRSLSQQSDDQNANLSYGKKLDGGDLSKR